MNIQTAGFALDQVGVLQDLDAVALKEVAAVMQPTRLSSGTMLFDEGDTGDTLYIVAHGRLRVSVMTPSGGRRIVAELGRGESVGEMALLTGEKRSARVEAIRDSIMLALSRPAFERVVEQYPRVMTQLARQLVARLKNTLRGGTDQGVISTICVLPAVSGFAISEFCRSFVTALEGIGPTLHLTRENVNASIRTSVGYTPSDSSDTLLLAWLNVQEEKYSFVLYEACESDPVWTRLCARQADRILLVGRAEYDGPIPAVATRDRDTSKADARRELVLLNANGPVPGRMQRWLDVNRSLQGWHHVSDGSARDMARTARVASGNGIGLMLGGGGARSFAHIGVLRAMQERGLEFDVIGGVSGGAIIGCQIAFGATPREVKETARREFIERGLLMDFTVPIVSLIRGLRFANLLARIFGERSIEDTGQRFFCHSANLSRATMQVHDRGHAWRAVGASMSIPGIGPPVCDRGDLLVDGSVLTNLPVEVMREICPTRIMAVDVSAERELAVDSSWEEFPSPAKILLARPWRRRGIRVPTIMEILFRGAMLGSIVSERNVKDRVEFYLRPPLRGVALLDFKKLDQVEESAYRYASEMLDQWPFDLVSGAAK